MQTWRYESKLGAEQLQAELGLLERAYDRAQKFALDLAKLDLASSALRGGDGGLRPVRLVVGYVDDWRRVVDGTLLLEEAEPVEPPLSLGDGRQPG